MALSGEALVSGKMVQEGDLKRLRQWASSSALQQGFWRGLWNSLGSGLRTGWIRGEEAENRRGSKAARPSTPTPGHAHLRRAGPSITWWMVAAWTQSVESGPIPGTWKHALVEQVNEQ